MSRLSERSIYVVQSGVHSPFPVREFLLFNGDPRAGGVAIQPMELLGLDRTAHQLSTLAESRPELALVLALCRLLIPCLRYRGSGRHIVVEPWTSDDLRGSSLPADTKTQLARELAREQSNEFLRISSGEAPPAGSLAEAFWEAQTDLPTLPQQFEDPYLSEFAKRLYFLLIGGGSGNEEISSDEVQAAIRALQRSDFAELGLNLSARELRRLFKKLLAASMIFCSQLTGTVAETLVRDYLKRDPHPEPNALTDDDRAALHFHYGACPELGLVNVGFFFGNGPLSGALLDNLYHLYLMRAPEEERRSAGLDLHRFMYLVREYRGRRNDARAEERRENRQRRPRDPENTTYVQPQYQADARAQSPSARLEQTEEMEFIRGEILPRLRQHDKERFEALLAAKGDRQAAADALGISHVEFSRQWRQTTAPNIRSIREKLDHGDRHE